MNENKEKLEHITWELGNVFYRLQRRCKREKNKNKKKKMEEVVNDLRVLLWKLRTEVV